MNPYQKFLSLLVKDPLLVGTIVSHNADGSSSVQLPGGPVILARGQTVAVNSKAFVRSGWVEGAAPDLPYSEIQV